MKKYLLTFLVIILFYAASLAQDCSSASDCLQKATAIKKLTSKKLSLLDKGVKMAKNDKQMLAKLLTLRGMYHSQNGYRYSKEAVKDFKSAIKADKRYYLAKSYLGKVDSKYSDYEKKINYFNQLVAEFANQPLAYYDRAIILKKGNQNAKALGSFKKAYIMVLTDDNTEEMTLQQKSDICQKYCMAYMDVNSLYVYDEKSLKILESGEKAGSKDPLLLGQLAMAYYDNDNETKAKEMAKKASTYDTVKYYSKNVGGNFMWGFDAYNKDNTKGATNLWGASSYNGRPHPLINFYTAMAVWGHNLAAYDSNPSLWNGQVSKIKGWLRDTIKYGKGTKYNHLVKYAEINLAKL